MANKNKKSTHQIRVTLTEENYSHLKASAEKNYRTIAQEVNYRLNQLLSRPGGLDTPSPIIYPPGIRSPLPQSQPINIERTGYSRDPI